MFDPITFDFAAIRLKVASPDVIKTWSHGIVTKPETINYRTQKPEKDGLFSERIFGPSKDWECYCGKYKKIRYKGIVCDKCGVEVTRSIVRRERMGHIELASPVSHIWFLRGVPSKIGILLDLSVQQLEKVIYFANFIILRVDEALRTATLEQLQDEVHTKRKQIEGEWTRQLQELQSKPDSEERNAAIIRVNEQKNEHISELDDAGRLAETELAALAPMTIISETAYRDLSLKYGHVFEAGIGAEAIYTLLKAIDVPKFIHTLENELPDTTGAKRERLVRRIKLLKSLKKNGIHPEWMVMTVIPVIPPDLRPMVPLDGGRFATSDLNDLYRRVINRNNRLEQLISLNAPEVITRNEKRMLQEAVDALIDNSARQGKTVTASTGQKRQLKSIADMLKGKQGRFRQNLLGKRTDYSGRSVIVVGPHLQLHQCGLPKRMALELFKPFIISKLIAREIVHNVRSASRFIESGASVVWDILEEITKDAYVLLNRAPTLHRLGIQAFQPILIEGKAIQVHPMVCSAFNADFDGDQMAVHVPLTDEAKREARELMVSSKNLLKPATGEPVVTPNQDIVWGCFYLTSNRPVDAEAPVRRFGSPEEAVLAYQLRYVHLQEDILVRFGPTKRQMPEFEKGFLKTTAGRILFNRIVPEKLGYKNEVMDKRKIGSMVRLCIELYGRERTVEFLDATKELAFEYLTSSGMSWGMDDVPVIKEKPTLLREAERRVDEVHEQYAEGLLTESERSRQIIKEIWLPAMKEVVRLSKESLNKTGSIFSMIESGARGSWTQLTQIIGMKGLVTNPTGEIIELPVKGSFKEGFDVLEYFISTHGARKGLSDTALRTANAGYLTRRLVDVAQDLVVSEEDCGNVEGVVITSEESEAMGEHLVERIVGRYTIDDIKVGRKTVVKKDTFITEADGRSLTEYAAKSAHVRSVLTCKTIKGICQKCYGYDLGYNKPVAMGIAVGIIAAQSIGEPGTQLTMRTFHTGGVAGQDITQGLPRVEELFEGRTPPAFRRAFLADAPGKVSIIEEQRTMTDAEGKTVVVTARGQKVITIAYSDIECDRYGGKEADGTATESASGTAESKKKGRKKKVVTVVGDVLVKDGDAVPEGAALLRTKDGNTVPVRRAGIVSLSDDGIVSVKVAVDKLHEYIVPQGLDICVKDGDLVKAGDQLTDGAFDLHQLYILRGKRAVEQYIVKEIKSVYALHGQKLNDKHVELICRQLFSRVYVEKAGDTVLLPGEIVEKAEFLEENQRIEKEKKGGELAEANELLLGISKVSLSTRSFLSAASFQETARVLINAAVTGKVDHLEGLKENVIIGRLIPAGTGFRMPAPVAVPVEEKKE